MIEKVPLSDEELSLGLCLLDELLFANLFFADELELEMSPQQKMMMCDRSKKILVCTGRKIGKTVCIETKVLRRGLIHEQKGTGVTEGLLFTPRDSHLSPIIDRVYGRISRERFFKEFVTTSTRGESPKLVFKTGFVWYGRIEGSQGDQNMAGLRAAEILGDELSFGNDVNHNSRIQTALPDAHWWYSGVPSGVRSTPFYRLDQTSLGDGWSHHKYTTFVNPLYADPKKQDELTKAYGGKQSPGYITQVMGEWGDELLSSFPPGSIAVGHQPYFIKSLGAGLRNSDNAIAVSLGIPSVRADKFVFGFDFGFNPDPSVIVIAYTRGDDKWECYARIEMRQVPLPVQRRVVKYLYSTICLGKLGAIVCDNASAIQELQADNPAFADRFIIAKAGGTMVLTGDDGAPAMQMNEKTEQMDVVMVRTKQYLTEQFRKFMVNSLLDLPGIQLKLGNDQEAIDELSATTETKTEGGYTKYFGEHDSNASGKMKDHFVDSCRMLALGILLSRDAQGGESEAEFIAALGWAGEANGWTGAWDRKE